MKRTSSLSRRWETPVEVRRSGFSRPGWTLIELMAVISITAILANICIRLLIILMQAQSAFGVRAAEELTLQRLEDRLRSDVQSAVSVEVDESTEPAVLRMTLVSQNIVEYVLEPGKILRQVPGDQQNREFDRFFLKGVAPAATVDADLVTLTLNRAVDKSATTDDLAIKARLLSHLEPPMEGTP